jgi:Type IV pili methyl-accepting chemotaxis transducer N-term
MRRLYTRREVIASSLLAVGLGALPVVAQSQAVLGAMINSAGRNRMHSQRIARCYAQLVIDIDADAARRQMAQSLSAAGGALDALELNPPNAAIRGAAKAARGAFDGFKALVQSAPGRDKLKAVNGAAEEFFAASNALTVAVQDFAQQKAAKLTNDAGAQRPRVMRLAKCYLMELGGLSLRDEIRAAKTQFEAIHAALEQAPESNGTIRAQLDLVKIQFGFIVTAVDTTIVDSAKFARAAVSTSERVVDLMDEVVKAYALQVKA